MNLFLITLSIPVQILIALTFLLGNRETFVYSIPHTDVEIFCECQRKFRILWEKTIVLLVASFEFLKTTKIHKNQIDELEL